VPKDVVWYASLVVGHRGKEREREAQELQEVLLRQGMFLDKAQDDIDLTKPTVQRRIRTL
jgi:hypothetical protein